MGGPDMELQVATTWAIGGPLRIKWLHTAHDDSKGIVLAFEPFRRLRYSQLASISQLPDDPASYSVLDFELVPAEPGTELLLRITGFPTETIFQHLDFYWRATLTLFKKFVEDETTETVDRQG
jgi:hypothetical protein